MPSPEDPYTVIGIPSTASDDEIRSAYRRAIRRSHPDIVGDAGTEQTARINAAYSLIGTPSARAAYDRQSRAQEHEPQPAASRPQSQDNTRPGDAGPQMPAPRQPHADAAQHPAADSRAEDETTVWPVRPFVNAAIASMIATALVAASIWLIIADSMDNVPYRPLSTAYIPLGFLATVLLFTRFRRPLGWTVLVLGALAAPVAIIVGGTAGQIAATAGSGAIAAALALPAATLIARTARRRAFALWALRTR